MGENFQKSKGSSIFKSKFFRSIFLQTISIFIIVVIVITSIVFVSFTSEINDRIVLARQKQLEVISNDLSKRMSEISSIAYNISKDRTFLLEPVENENNGYEMSKTLERYLVGNDYIEHVAYYRLAEPDTIYVSSGEISFSDFWCVYLGLDADTASGIIENIRNTREPAVKALSFGGKEKSFIAYICPLPQLSQKPQAYVLMLIPITEVEQILETQLANCYGKVAMFDSSGDMIYSISNLEQDIEVDYSFEGTEKYFTYDGCKYVMQRTTSDSNGWTYVSVIRLEDMISETANKQLYFIVMLLVIMFVAISVLLLGIVVQYKPINSLAASLNEKDENEVIDEQNLLSDTFAALMDDSEQKQRFETAYYAAEAANKAKSAFLSNMSHDIRTPMNAIVGMTEIAMENSDNPEYVKECLKKVRISSNYLLDIINNVLDMSRIESGKFTLSEDIVEFPKLIYGVITILNQSIDIKSLNLSVEVENFRDERVIGDTVRITQVFMNILSNSVKFTPNGGTISLRATQLSSENGYGDYQFVFSDTGVGISPEFQKIVFDTFTRDENAKVSKIEGTGLGMAIAKNFVEMMGGQIECNSAEGKGTTFTVSMRLKIAEKDEKTVDFEKNSKMSVLVIGDKNRSDVFAEIGAKSDYAHDVTEAVLMAKKNSYDYIVINQRNDDKSGVNAVTLMKKSGIGNATFILAATDLYNIEKSAAFNAGISAFLQSPFFRSTALAILDRGFEKLDEANSVSTVDLSGKRILLVEDNHINMQVVRMQLSKTNAEVIEAINGKEAVELFKENEQGHFDLILMDVQMPVMNGFEATEAIRSFAREDAKTIPIYAMTANTFDEDVRQVKEAGMNGHLGKPYEASELYRLLAGAVMPHVDDAN